MAQKSEQIGWKAAYHAYLSDFYYAIAIVIFLVAAYYMFNEPTGVTMLSFDFSIVLVAAAIFYVAANLTGEMILKFLSKYLVLVGLMVTSYQFMADYGPLSVLQAVFFITIMLFVVIFILDLILYLKSVLEMIWNWVAKRR